MNIDSLVHDCLKGRAEAQRKLYELFAEPMFGVCYRYTRSTEDAQDVLQEGFIKVFRNLGQYKFKGELGAWIRRIMVNTAINYIKQHKKHPAMFETSIAENAPAQDTPEIRMNSKDLADLIRDLPPGYQMIFNLHAVEGYSHVEIGTLLGISEGTSRSQYSRARAQLIERLNAHQKKISQQADYVR